MLFVFFKCGWLRSFLKRQHSDRVMLPIPTRLVRAKAVMTGLGPFFSLAPSTLAKSRHLHRMAQFHPLYVGAITGAGRTIVASRISGRGLEIGFL